MSKTAETPYPIRLHIPIIYTMYRSTPKGQLIGHYFTGQFCLQLRLLTHSGSFLASQKARNATVRAEKLLICVIESLLHLLVFELFIVFTHLATQALSTRRIRTSTRILLVFYQHPAWFISLYYPPFNFRVILLATLRHMV